MYFPWRGSHFAIIDAGSKHWLVISATLNCSWYAFSAEMTGAYDDNTKWIRGYGTKLVWNSVTSTFNAPSKRRDAVSEEITCQKRKEEERKKERKKGKKGKKKMTIQIIKQTKKLRRQRETLQKRKKEKQSKTSPTAGMIKTKTKTKTKNLSNEPVQVGICGSFNIEVTTANIIDRLIVQHAGNISVLQQGVGGQDTVVRLNNSSWHLNRTKQNQKNNKSQQRSQIIMFSPFPPSLSFALSHGCDEVRDCEVAEREREREWQETNEQTDDRSWWGAEVIVKWYHLISTWGDGYTVNPSLDFFP